MGYAKGTTKKNAAKKNFLGASQKLKGQINGYSELLLKQQKRLAALRRRVLRNHQKIQEIEAIDERLQAKTTIVMRPSVLKRRLSNPTSDQIKPFSKHTRRQETYNMALAIHGGTAGNKVPALLGLADSLTAKFTVDTLAGQLFQSKPKIKRALIEKAELQSKTEYESSDENLKRSLNVYYSHDAMGKQKYKKMRRANKTKQKQVPNFVPWEKLSKHIRDIDIGKVKDISKFTKGVDEEEVGPGCYRPFFKIDTIR